MLQMRVRRLLRLTLQVATLATIAASTGTSVSLAQTKPRCGAYPVVDFRAASVAGIAFDTTLSAIRAAIGSANIRRYMVDSEEGRVPAYSLRLCGHPIDWSQDGVSWTDSAYRSPEGLGVGSTLSAFDSAFGIGKISADHGLQVRYELDRRKMYVEVGDCYTIGPVSTVDRRCRVDAIALMFPNRR